LRKIDPPLLLTIRGAAAINVEQQLSLFEIHYKNMMTVVTLQNKVLEGYEAY